MCALKNVQRRSCTVNKCNIPRANRLALKGKDLNLMRSRGAKRLNPTVFYLQTCFFHEVHSLACHIQFLLFIFLWLGEKGCELAAVSWLSAASPISAVVQNWFLGTVLHVLFQVSPDSRARVCGRQQLSPLAKISEAAQKRAQLGKIDLFRLASRRADEHTRSSHNWVMGD